MKGEKKILEEESNARKADLGEDREMKIAPSCWQTGASKHNTNGRIKKKNKKSKVFNSTSECWRGRNYAKKFKDINFFTRKQIESAAL